MKVNRRLATTLAMLLVTPAAAQQTADVSFSTVHSGDRKPLHTVVPIYPARALRDRIEGDVEVCFEVDRNGRTSRVAVRNSSNRLFEKVAKQAVRESTYAKLAENRVLSGIKTCRTFRFRLDSVPASERDVASDEAEP